MQPNFWYSVVVEARGTAGGDDNRKLLIFDSMGGPQLVYTKDT